MAYDPHEVADPFGDAAQPAPKRSPKVLIWVLALLLGGGVCCVGSCVALAIFGFKLGEEQVAAQVREIPEFKQEIGVLRSISLEFNKSSQDGDDSAWFYAVEGSAGSGMLWVRVDDAPGGKKIVREATLKTAEGKMVAIPIP